MRIGIISDVHSNLEALEKVIEDIDSKDLDKIMCAGDLVGYGASPNKVVSKFRELNINSVKGNHDKAVKGRAFNFNSTARRALKWTREELSEENKKFLENLSEKIEKEINGNKLLMAHGSPQNPINEYVYPREVSEGWIEINNVSGKDLVILGHTHIPFKKRVKGTLVINPGSVGQPRNREPGAYYSILDLGKENLKAEMVRLDYNIDKPADKIKEAGLPFSLADRLYKGV